MAGGAAGYLYADIAVPRIPIFATFLIPKNSGTFCLKSIDMPGKECCLSLWSNVKEEIEISKSALVELIVGIILICLFLPSWLVFKNIKPSDWGALGLGNLDLIIFALTIKKEKK